MIYKGWYAIKTNQPTNQPWTKFNKIYTNGRVFALEWGLVSKFQKLF